MSILISLIRPADMLYTYQCLPRENIKYVFGFVLCLLKWKQGVVCLHRNKLQMNHPLTEILVIKAPAYSSISYYITNLQKVLTSSN